MTLIYRYTGETRRENLTIVESEDDLCHHISFHGKFADSSEEHPEYIVPVEIKCQECQKTFLVSHGVN